MWYCTLRPETVGLSAVFCNCRQGFGSGLRLTIAVWGAGSSSCNNSILSNIFHIYTFNKNFFYNSRRLELLLAFAINPILTFVNPDQYCSETRSESRQNDWIRNPDCRFIIYRDQKKLKKLCRQNMEVQIYFPYSSSIFIFINSWKSHSTFFFRITIPNFTILQNRFGLSTRINLIWYKMSCSSLSNHEGMTKSWRKIENGWNCLFCKSFSSFKI